MIHPASDDLDTVLDVSDSDCLLPHLIGYLHGHSLPAPLSPRSHGQIKSAARFFCLKDGRLHRKLTRTGHLYEVPYVPPSARQEVLARFHVTLGHMASATLLPLLESRHWWPGISGDVRTFISECLPCQLGSRESPSRHTLHPDAPVGLPFVKWGIDVIQDLPPSLSGRTQIITAIDYSTNPWR